jgi:hypothetical protein
LAIATVVGQYVVSAFDPTHADCKCRMEEWPLCQLPQASDQAKLGRDL